MKILFGIFEEEMNYAASILGNLAFQAGWEIDCTYYTPDISEAEIEAALSESKPDLVALSFMLFSRQLAFKIAKVAKNRGIKVIAGGIHPSTCPDDLAQSGYFDSIVVGDGMGVFEQLSGSYKQLDGDITPGKQHPDQEAYVRRYFTEGQKQKIRATKSFDIFTSLGCPYNCYFCSANVTVGFIKLPVNTVVEELVKAKNEYDIERVTVHDETFTLNADRIREFRIQLEKENLSFSYSADTRVNCFTEEIAQELKMLGVEDLYFGLETASPRLLKFLNKKFTVGDALRASDICRKYNYAFRINLMMGLPTQNEDDYEATLEFVKQTQPQAVSIYNFIPYPETYLYDYCLKNGYLLRDTSFECYLGLDTVSERVKRWLSGRCRERKGILNKIDYEMAEFYRSEIEKIVDSNREKCIVEGVKKADKKKWVLFGTGVYFYTVLEKISKLALSNCLGYYDYNKQGYKAKIYDFNIKKYNCIEMKEKPEIIVVTANKRGKLFAKVIYPLIKEKFNLEGEIVSVSNY